MNCEVHKFTIEHEVAVVVGASTADERMNFEAVNGRMAKCTI